MGGNDETIARLISKRAKLDPTGFAAASKRGDIKGYCQTELKRLGISEEEFKQFLNKHSKDLGLPESNANVERAAEKAKVIVEETLSNVNLEGISEMLDKHIFDEQYEKETQGSLDAQLNERLIQLNTNGAEGIRHIKRKLDFPKCAATGMSVVFGAYALGAFFKGSLVTAVVQGLLAHDLSIAAYNCHLKAYLLHGTRRIGATPASFGSAILNSITSAVTGAADPNLAYLKEVDVSLVFQGSLIPLMLQRGRDWLVQHIDRATR
jgi:hypothetical protein